jgi:hypothetical protein
VVTASAIPAEMARTVAVVGWGNHAEYEAIELYARRQAGRIQARGGE